MKQFACSDVVPGCDGVVTGETEDEIHGLEKELDHWKV